MKKEIKVKEQVSDVKTDKTFKVVGKKIITTITSSGPANYDGYLVGSFSSTQEHVMDKEGAEHIVSKLEIDEIKLEKQVLETRGKIEALDLVGVDETLMKRMSQYNAWVEGEKLKEQLKAQEDMLVKITADKKQVLSLIKQVK